MTVKLFYTQAACSLAPHIALREAGLDFTLEAVDLRAKTYQGGDFKKINPKGYVPALQLDSGEVLTEAAIILQYIADQKPESGLLPKAGTMERYRHLESLHFIATELHKGFGPLWNPQTPQEYKEMTKANLGKKFEALDLHLENGGFLMGERFSVADAYLFTIVNWSAFVGIDLSKWPALMGYVERVRSRPAVHAALQAEGLLK